MDKNLILVFLAFVVVAAQIHATNADDSETTDSPMSTPAPSGDTTDSPTSTSAPSGNTTDSPMSTSAPSGDTTDSPMSTSAPTGDTTHSPMSTPAPTEGPFSVYSYTYTATVNTSYTKEMGDISSKIFKELAAKIGNGTTSELRWKTNDSTAFAAVNMIQDGKNGTIKLRIHVSHSFKVNVSKENIKAAITEGLKKLGYTVSAAEVSDQMMYTHKDLPPPTPPADKQRMEVEYRVILNDDFKDEYKDDKSDEFKNKVKELKIKIIYGFSQLDGVPKLIAIDITTLFDGSLGMDLKISFELSDKPETSESLKRAILQALIIGGLNVKSVEVVSWSKHPKPKPKPESMSVFKIIFIVAMCIIGAIVLVGAIVMFMRHKKAKKEKRGPPVSDTFRWNQ